MNKKCNKFFISLISKKKLPPLLAKLVKQLINPQINLFSWKKTNYNFKYRIKEIRSFQLKEVTYLSKRVIHKLDEQANNF